MKNSFSRFIPIQISFLPCKGGEGETMANQAVVAMTMLVNNWIYYGDVFHNEFFGGGFNDLSSYAEWLYHNIHETREELEKVFYSISKIKYTKILYSVFDIIEKKIDELDKREKNGSIYKNSEKRIFFFFNGRTREKKRRKFLRIDKKMQKKIKKC